MRHLTLGAIVMVVLALGMSTVALGQAAPEFKLGFKALADQIPEVVGQPLENEHWGANGDSLQQTSTGLMVWRKADNWTAFTNGSRTWINGPAGVQDRGNDQRFDWEAPMTAAPQPVPAPPPVAPAPPPAAPAPTPATLTRYSPEVKAMDDQAAAHGVMVSGFMKEVETEWANNWGWRPTRPMAVSLFMDVNRFAETIAAVRGRPLTEAERTMMVNSRAYWGNDARTNGWAILVNLNLGYGRPNWEPTIKMQLARAYSDFMLGNLAGYRSPRWFRSGFADLLAFSKVPANTVDDSRTQLLTRYLSAGRLPTLRYMHENFDSMVTAGGESANLAWGMGDMAIAYLADKIGGQGLMELEKRVGTGDNFETALQAMTGYTLEKLDTEYRVKIPR